MIKSDMGHFNKDFKFSGAVWIDYALSHIVL
jgi:hypothetical protein